MLMIDFIRRDRASWRKQKEDELVLEGQEAIDTYRAFLVKRWEKAKCLAEKDGVNLGFEIVKKAQIRLDAGE
jgi:hypothetical protein